MCFFSHFPCIICLLFFECCTFFPATHQKLKKKPFSCNLEKGFSTGLFVSNNCQMKVDLLYICCTLDDPVVCFANCTLYFIIIHPIINTYVHTGGFDKTLHCEIHLFQVLKPISLPPKQIFCIPHLQGRLFVHPIGNNGKCNYKCTENIYRRLIS